jgi:hypothetical protein
VWTGGTVAASVVSAGVGWLFAASQAVRGQAAIDQAHEADAAGKDPVSVSAAYRSINDDDFGWVFPRPLSHDQEANLLATHDASSPGVWAIKQGGVRTAWAPRYAFCFSRLRLTLQGQWVRPVLITQMRALVQRSAPLAGTLIWVGSAGESSIIEIGFDLDEKAPIARSRTESITLGGPYLDNHQLTVAPGEIVSLDVMAQTREHFCEWRIEFTYKVDQKTVTRVVGDGDAPFRTSALTNNYQARYFYSYSPGGLPYWRVDGPGGGPPK